MATMRTAQETREYNGHRNRNCWRVYLWLSCASGMERRICELVGKHGIGRTTAMLHDQMKGRVMLDGTGFTKVAIRDSVRKFG